MEVPPRGYATVSYTHPDSFWPNTKVSCSTAVATVSQSTFEDTMRVLCSYCMSSTSYHSTHKVPYVAGPRNLDVYIHTPYLLYMGHSVSIQPPKNSTATWLLQMANWQVLQFEWKLTKKKKKKKKKRKVCHNTQTACQLKSPYKPDLSNLEGQAPIGWITQNDPYLFCLWIS